MNERIIGSADSCMDERRHSRNARCAAVAAAVVLSILPVACERSGAPASPSTAAPSVESSATSASAPTAEAGRAAPSPPPAPVPTFALSAGARQAKSADGTYSVRWEPVDGAIPDAEPFAIRCEVVRTDGKPLSRAALVLVDAEMPHHGHGMNLVPSVAPAGAGKFVASGMLLHMPGRWVIAIDVEEDGVAERAQWYVDIE